METKDADEHYRGLSIIADQRDRAQADAAYLLAESKVIKAERDQARAALIQEQTNAITHYRQMAELARERDQARTERDELLNAIKLHLANHENGCAYLDEVLAKLENQTDD